MSPVCLSNDPPDVGAAARLVRNVAEAPGNPMGDRNSGSEERTFVRFEIFFGHPFAFEYDGRFRSRPKEGSVWRRWARVPTLQQLSRLERRRYS